MRVCVVCGARVSSVSTPKTRKAVAFPHSLTASLTSAPWYPSQFYDAIDIRNNNKKISKDVVTKVDLGECNIKMCHSLGKFLPFQKSKSLNVSTWSEIVWCNFCRGSIFHSVDYKT